MKQLCWLLCFISGPLFAQDNLDYLFALSLEELLRVEVRGATLTSQNMQTVPAAVTVFTHAQIQRMGLDTLNELMNLVPGFQSYRTSILPLNHPFSSRGRRIANISAEILVLLDGRRLEDPGGSGAAEIIPRFPLVQVARVEFIRGPGAAVYGSNAMMGVINIISRKGVNEAGVSYGSFNRRQGYLLNSHQWNELLVDVFAHGEVDDGADFRLLDTHDVIANDPHIDSDDPVELAHLSVKFSWHNTRAELFHTQYKAQNFYSVNTVSNGFNEYSTSLSAVSVHQEFRWGTLVSNTSLSYSLTKAQLSGQFSPAGAFNDATLSNPVSDEALFASANYDDASETRWQWHTDWYMDENSSLQFGLELRYIYNAGGIASNNFDLGELASGSFPITHYEGLQPTTVVVTPSNREIIGLYGQYQRKPLEQTRLTLGIRFDHFSTLGSRVNPRLALVQQLNPHHTLKLLYGEAFRAPAEFELNSVNNPILVSNPDLKPETVQTWELIWVGQWQGTGLSMGYFENRFKDAIALLNMDGLNVFTNTKLAPSKGFEFELSHQLNQQWQLHTTYTHLTQTPGLAFSEASQLASFMANYQMAEMNLNLIASYAGSREFSVEGERSPLDGYWQVFAQLGYHFSKELQGFVQVKNLLDDNYRTPTDVSSLSEGVPNRGREILAGLNWKF